MPEIVLVAFIMALGFGAYWSLVLFPRQRDFKKRQDMARTLVEGDEVITAGGMIGKVLEIDSENGVAIVEIASGVKTRVLIAALLQRYDPEEIAQNANQGRKQQTDPDAPVY
jgi:preprotein translocase subunit YajC